MTDERTHISDLEVSVGETDSKPFDVTSLSVSVGDALKTEALGELMKRRREQSREQDVDPHAAPRDSDEELLENYAEIVPDREELRSCVAADMSDESLAGRFGEAVTADMNDALLDAFRHGSVGGSSEAYSFKTTEADVEVVLDRFEELRLWERLPPRPVAAVEVSAVLPREPTHDLSVYGFGASPHDLLAVASRKLYLLTLGDGDAWVKATSLDKTNAADSELETLLKQAGMLGGIDGPAKDNPCKLAVSESLGSTTKYRSQNGRMNTVRGREAYRKSLIKEIFGVESD